MAFDLTGLGQWSEESDFKVEAARTAAYAAATNDTNPAHAGGQVAPPIFAVVPIWEAMIAAVGKVTPPEILMRVVHGEQDMRFHQPLVPGAMLRSRAAPIGVQVRGSGTTLVVKMETRDETGDLVNEQYATTFFRGVTDGDSGGEPPPEHKLTAEVKATGPLAEVTYAIDADQTFRYADASGDRMPIHLDDNMAKAVGLPGIIVHGLCTMAFASRALVEALCDGDSARLRRMAVRFSRPVLPGEAITTRIYRGGNGSGVHGFEVANPEGQLVVKDGLAEVGI
jgi:acyl dehydratase